MARVPICDLNSSGCLSLDNILESFNAPISEEHAWALSYQCAKCGKNLLDQDTQSEGLYLVTEISELLIHQDGYVHPDSFLSRRDEEFKKSENEDSTPSCTFSRSKSQARIISSLGLVLFKALDYGLREDEERQFSPDLENLLCSMSGAKELPDRQETDDEGIERDSGDSDEENSRSFVFNFDSILSLCSKRLGGNSSLLSSSNNSISNSNGVNASNVPNSQKTPADSHYKAVCRAFVNEAQELSSFLQKVSCDGGSISTSLNGSLVPGNGHNTFLDPDLEKLNFSDWTKLWVQVIRELRNGVKLKKVEAGLVHDCTRAHPIEYELTPYEILMDDIRSRRYTLNKVMVNGELPRRIKKDAHAIILEFIRSRPPLKKAADRVLGPPPERVIDPIERLMASIRQEHQLRPTKVNQRKEVEEQLKKSKLTRSSSITNMTEISAINDSKSSQRMTYSSSPARSVKSSDENHKNGAVERGKKPKKKLIKADLDYLYSLNPDDVGFDDEEEDNQIISSEPIRNGSCFFGHFCPDGTRSTPLSPVRKIPGEMMRNVGISVQWHKGDEKKRKRGVNLQRRHTICCPSVKNEHGATVITFPFEFSYNGGNAFSGLNGPSVSPLMRRRKNDIPHSMSKSSIQEEFFQSDHWHTAVECLSLSLEEVVHIRNVLTKAELETLPVECSLKEDVEKGRVCFLCLKTRFNFWNFRSNTCRLCKRIVCAKCCEKMRIPMEHFANIPVTTLSPSISPKEEEKDFPGLIKSCPFVSKNSLRKNSLGSAPTSPNMSKERRCLVDGGGDSDGSHRSMSPSLLDPEEKDRGSPDSSSGSGPYSLPTVTSISMGLMAFKKKKFGKRKTAERSEQLKGSLMTVCHDCKAMVLQVIRSSRAKRPSIGNSNKINMTFNLAK